MMILTLESFDSFEAIAQKEQNQQEIKPYYKGFEDSNTQTHNLSSVKETFIPYQSKTKPNFTIQYPSNWQITEHKEADGLMFQLPKSNEINSFVTFNMTVQKSNIMTPAFLPLQADIVIDNYNSTLQNFQLYESEEFKLIDNTSHMLKFTYTDPKYGKVGGMDIVTLANGYIYIMKYRATILQYDNYLPIVVHMIDSLQIKKSQKLYVTTTIAKNPIVTGEYQTINFIIKDSNSGGQSIKGVKILGLADADTANENRFTLFTDHRGMASYSWKIPESYLPGTYTLTIQIVADGYNPQLYLKEFEIISE